MPFEGYFKYPQRFIYEKTKIENIFPEMRSFVKLMKKQSANFNLDDIFYFLLECLDIFTTTPTNM